MIMEIKALVIAGPSAVGKTTVGNIVLQEDPRFRLSRSVTTRAPRGDAYDAEYIYLSREEFEALRDRGELLEWTEYSGDLYGTALSELERISSEGCTPLLILDLKGVRSVGESKRGIAPCILYVYDELNVMEERLYARYLAKDPTPEKLRSFVKRKEKNIKDYKDLPEIAEGFYAFVRNSGEPESTAKLVLEAYAAFENGKEACLGDINEVASALAASALRKEEAPLGEEDNV